MSDLISRKKVIDILEKEKSLRCSYDADITILSIEKWIRELPTAYSVDKVVEKLEENASRYTKKYLTPYGNNGYRDVKAISIHKAVEIIKQDGAGTETETIRDKAVKWNNNSSKRVPYEFIDYVEGKREICVSDNVCEWKVKSNYYVTECSHDTDVMYGLKQDFKFCPYCGKKIKVVE